MLPMDCMALLINSFLVHFKKLIVMIIAKIEDVSQL